MRLLFQLLLFVWTLSACTPYRADNLDEETEIDGGKLPHADVLREVSLMLENPQSLSLSFPMHLVVFDEKDKVVAEKEIESEASMTLTMPDGTYQIALTNDFPKEQFEQPLITSPDAYFKIQAPGRLDKPIWLGNSTLKVTKNTRIYMEPAYLMSGIQFRFTQFPPESTDVKVRFSPVSDGFSLNGGLRPNTSTVALDCVKEGNDWVAGPVYVFPLENSACSMSISLLLKGEEIHFSHTYYEGLKRGKPYRFKGKYENGKILTTLFEQNRWVVAIEDSFVLDEPITPEPHVTPPTPDDDTPPDTPHDTDSPDAETPSDGENNSPATSNETLVVPTLPEVGGFVERCMVWDVKQLSETEVEVVLIAPEYYSVVASEGKSVLAKYRYLERAGWRVFTINEARDFIDTFRDNMDELNGLMTDHESDIFIKNSIARYLCNDCNSSFSLETGTITKVGTKKTYYMRPVITLKLRLQP